MKARTVKEEVHKIIEKYREFGNIFKKDLKDILYEKKYVELRKSIIKNTFNLICDLYPD